MGRLRPPHAAVGRSWKIDGKEPHSRNEGQQRFPKLCIQPNTQTGFYQLRGFQILHRVEKQE